MAAAAVRLAGGVAILGFTAACLWSRDDRLRAAPSVARALAAGRLADDRALTALSGELLAATIASRSVAGLAAHVLRASAAGLVVATIAWAMALPPYAPALFGDAGSLARFLSRLFSTGLVTVFLVGWIAAAVAGRMAGRIASAGPTGVAGFILLDLIVRLAALMVLTGATYVLFAHVVGSFGGSWRTALRVVPETLATALALQSLSSVYVYACLLSASLYLVLLLRLSARYAVFPALWCRMARLLPLRDRPVRFLGVVLGAIAAVLAMAGSAAVGLA